MAYMRSNQPWLYDDATGDMVGVKDADGGELYFMRVPYIGTFFDVSDQAAEANTATAMECDTTGISSGISVVDASKFTVIRAGVYNIQFSAQLFNTDSVDHDASIWLRKNGADVADTCTDITVPSRHRHGSTDGAAVAAWNFFVQLAKGDYVQLMWSTPSATVTIQHTAARTAPVRPAIPSLIVTINEVDGMASH